VTRRGHGEGSVYRRADGRWEAALQVNGRRRRWVGRTRATVAGLLAEAQHATGHGLPLPGARTAVAAFLDRWLEAVEPHLRPRSLQHYRYFAAMISGEIGALKLARLGPDEVGAMLTRLRDRGLSPRTCAHARAVLRTALHDAEKWGLVSRNAARLADPPRVPRPTPKTLPPAEVNRMLAAVRQTDVGHLVAVALHTGMRQGELLGLRWSDLDFAKRQLTVGASLQRLGSESALVEPKSEHSRRTLRLSAPALEALQAERQCQLEAKLAAGPAWQPTIAGLVFTDRLGAPLVGTTVTHAFQRTLRVAGLPPLRFHHLRHLFGALMLGSGVDLATVSHMLGHSSVALTASTYAGVLPSLRDDAVERFERFLSQPT
jgi:integrase